MEIPSNRTINEVMENAEVALEETKCEQRGKLNRTGKEIIEQAEKLIYDARRFVNEKNRNDLIQQIIREGSEVVKDIQENREQWRALQRAMNEFDSDELRKKMDNLSRTAKLVAIELISSASFRQSVYDFFSVLYSVLVDASHLDKVGRPLREAFDQVSGQIGVVVEKGKEVVEEELGVGEGEGKKKRRKRKGKGKKTGEEPMKGLQEAAGETAEKLKEAGEQAVKLALNVMDPERPLVKLTDEQREILLDKLRDILRNFAKRERTQRIIHGLFDILDLISRPISKLTEQASATAENIVEDRHLTRMLCLTQQLFEAFTHRSLTPLLSHVKVLYRSITDDPELRSYFSELKQFFLSTLEHPEMIGSEETRNRMNELIDRGRALAEQKKGLRYNFSVMREEVNEMIYSIERDPITIALEQDIKNLAEMILLDSNGRVTFKPEVLDQLKVIVLSALVKRLKFPIPPITFDDGENLRFTVTGLMVGIQDVLPDRIIAENHGLAILNMKELETGPNLERAAEAVRIKLEHINVHMPEADLWFHRRSFPEIQDSGKAKIDIGGDGMDITFILKAAKGSDRLFMLEKVECVIHSLDLKLEQTHHDTMYNTLITIFKGFVKRNIEDAIQESVASVFEQLTDQVEKQVKNLRANLPLTGAY